MDKPITEIVTDYICDDNYYHVDAYTSHDENEQGFTVALVCADTHKVVFTNNKYRSDEKIKSAIRDIWSKLDAPIISIIDSLHPNDKAALRGESLDYSLSYKVMSDNRVVVNVSYYNNWAGEQQTTTPFPDFESIEEAMKTVLQVISKLKQEKLDLLVSSL